MTQYLRRSHDISRNSRSPGHVPRSSAGVQRRAGHIVQAELLSGHATASTRKDPPPAETIAPATHFLSISESSAQYADYQQRHCTKLTAAVRQHSEPHNGSYILCTRHRRTAFAPCPPFRLATCARDFQSTTSRRGALYTVNIGNIRNQSLRLVFVTCSIS